MPNSALTAPAAEFGPKQVGVPLSEDDLNSQSYDHFVLNEKFKECEVPSSATVNATAKQLFREYKEKAFNQTLNETELENWQIVADGFVESFEEELGAIIYNSIQYRWIFCGLVALGPSFLGPPGNRSLCSPIVSVGLPNITRTPVDGKDYFSNSTLTAIQASVELESPILRTAKHSARQYVGYENDTYDYIFVDVFSDESEADYYDDVCEGTFVFQPFHILIHHLHTI